MTGPFDFTGYRVVVAGGSKGIGRCIALGFAEAGAAVSVCARGQDALNVVSGELSAHGGIVHACSCDLADPAAIRDYIESAAAALDGIDVLVNNATGFGFDAEDDESWLADFNLDLMAAVRASRAALPYLQASAHPCILHTSSIAAFHPTTMGPPYAAMKAALVHYTATQALQLAEHRIRVNAIAPGSIDFPGGVWDTCHRENPDRYAQVLAGIPFGRFGRPEEIAHAALFLASPWAGWITGHTLVVDGGQLLRA